MMRQVAVILSCVSLLIGMPTVARAQLTRSEAQACHVVAGLADTDQIGKALVEPHVMSGQEAARQLRDEGGLVSNWNGVRVWKHDINNDGIPEVIVETEDQQVSPTIHARAERGNSLGETFEGSEEETTFRVIAVNGAYYVLGQNWRGYVTRLLAFRADRKLKQICQFQQTDEPVVLLTKGKREPLCNAVTKGQGKHVEFSGDHRVNLTHEDRFWAKSLISGMAVADIDNDGESDKVVRLMFLPGNGRQCDSILLAATDQKGEEIPDTATNRALATMEECVPVSSPDSIGILSFGEKNYIDARGWEGDRTIYMVANTRFVTVCQFHGHRNIKVVVEGSPAK